MVVPIEIETLSSQVMDFVDAVRAVPLATRPPELRGRLGSWGGGVTTPLLGAWLAERGWPGWHMDYTEDGPSRRRHWWLSSDHPYVVELGGRPFGLRRSVYVGGPEWHALRFEIRGRDSANFLTWPAGVGEYLEPIWSALCLVAARRVALSAVAREPR